MTPDAERIAAIALTEDGATDVTTVLTVPAGVEGEGRIEYRSGGVVAGAGGVAGFGPVQTHALYLGSLAIDAGTNAGSFSYDQRGPGFPRTIGGNTDIGAFEGAIPRPVSNPTAVPALGPWMLGALSALLGLMGFARSRRRS